jgi:cation diffusion facilitator CzcD-associated flavoprotein CzcO
MSLHALEADVRRTFELLGGTPRSWVASHRGIDHDVVVVGGGQSGSGIAASLRRAGIGNVLVIDAGKDGAQGIWRDHTYMRTLRTPKGNYGPDIGVGALTYRAWYEAQFGAASYAALPQIDRLSWDDYLAWLRRQLSVEISFETRLLSIGGTGTVVHLEVEGPAGRRLIKARKVVLATGVDGTGAPLIPAIVRDGLQPELYAHSLSRIDAGKLRDRRIAVLGASSSAFDVAAFALESGAAEVRLFCRQADLVRSSQLKALATPAVEYFELLTDAQKWEIGRLAKARGSVPTLDSIRRAVAFANFHIHLDAPWKSVTANDRSFAVRARDETFAFDFLLLGTGFAIDAALRPELVPIAAQIARWGDRFRPSADEEEPLLARYPYLGSGYRFLRRDPSGAAFIENIHCFNSAAQLSFGRILGDIASLAAGIPRLVQTIAADLFVADRDAHAASFAAPVGEDLDRNEYSAAVWPGRSPSPSEETNPAHAKQIIR